MSIVDMSHSMGIKTRINYVTSAIADFLDLVLMKLGTTKLRSVGKITKEELELKIKKLAKTKDIFGFWVDDFY